MTSLLLIVRRSFSDYFIISLLMTVVVGPCYRILQDDFVGGYRSTIIFLIIISDILHS